MLQHLSVLVAAVVLNFFLPRAMPGSPLHYLAGEEVARLSASERQQVLAQYGLDQPLGAQFVRYLGQLLQGNLGRSFQYNQGVTQVVIERLPWTLLLTGSALVLASLLGVGLGALAAWFRGGWLERTTLGAAVLLDALPTFWLGMVLIAIFAVQLRWLPIFGAYTPWAGYSGWAALVDVLRHMALPLTTLTLAGFSGYYLVSRFSMLGVLGEDYIRTARAKGVPEHRVIFKHAWRNAVLPVFTVFMLNLGSLVGGAVVVEMVFSYPGLGRLLFEAASTRDYPLLQGTFLLLTLSVVFFNLLADFLYSWLDPRARRDA